MFTVNYALNDRMLGHPTPECRKTFEDELTSEILDRFPAANVLITNCEIMGDYNIKVVGEITEDQRKIIADGVESIALEVYLAGRWITEGVH